VFDVFSLMGLQANFTVKNIGPGLDHVLLVATTEGIYCFIPKFEFTSGSMAGSIPIYSSPAIGK
jgi:hypothetical protein